MAKKSTRTKKNMADDNIDLDNPEFLKAWELLQYTRQSVFLTGKAGTGKSTFLRYITTHTKKKHVVLAPTGIAAVNVGGSTLHSFFRIPFKPITPDDSDFTRDRIKQRMKYPGYLVKLIQQVELIIIDEISMVRADIIDFIDKLLRTYSGNQREPFGGKQLLLVGDVFQLEPVVTSDMRDILRHYYHDFYFFSARAFSDIKIVPIELRKVYRQTDSDFVQLLDRIRMGNADSSDIARLNSRCTPSSTPDSKPTKTKNFTMTLATRRDMVDYINETHLKAIRKPTVTFMGKVRGDFPENSLPTDMELSLKEGAQVVFIKNDSERRWVNGSIGRVHALAADLLEVKLENGDIHTVQPEKWANIRYTYDSASKKIKEEELGSFEQYPVKLAWALTVHKSQGLTFNNVIIDMGRGAFTGGQTYVALSRCRSFEGMTLKSTVAERDIFVNPTIVNFSRSFNDPGLINGALEKAHADSCFDSALRHADAGELGAAFDSFIEGLRSRNILNDNSAMRLARRKLCIVDSLREKIDELQARIESDRLRFIDMADEYTSLGDDCRQDDMPIPAIANYDKALALIPDHCPALFGRAVAYQAMGDHEHALADFSAIIKCEPKNFDALLRMATIYNDLGDIHNAMDRCLLALDLSEEISCPRQSLSLLHSLLADLYDAVDDSASASHHRAIAKRLRQ